MPVPTRREAPQSTTGASGSNNAPQRLPTSSTSFQVQLPNNASTSATAACPLNTSDASVLTASILRSRAFAMATLQAQETLISGTDLPHLRQALSRLTSSSWLGVLEERHLLGQCAYPTCSRAPQRLSSSSSSGPTYRLDARSRRIEPDERMAPGGELTFCSKACWARAQWIRRWVLSKAREGEHDSKPEHERNEEMDEGGRWQVDGDDQYIELLEDLEARGEVTLPEETQSERLARERSEVARAAAANHVSAAPRNASAPPPRRGVSPTVEMSSSPPAAASFLSSSRPAQRTVIPAPLPLSRPARIDPTEPLDSPMLLASSPPTSASSSSALRSPNLNGARSDGPRRPNRTANAAATAPSDSLLIIERGAHADRERQEALSTTSSDAMDVEPSPASGSSVAPVEPDSMDELFRLANVAREQERRAGNWDDGNEETRLVEAIEGMEMQY